MTPDATAGTRILEGLDDLQTFRSQLEHVRSLVRMMEGRRRAQPDAPETASVSKPAKTSLLRRLARSA
jgi:hypothetical protein